MRITVLTMFPQSFDSFKDTPVLKRAVRNGGVSFSTVDIKDYAGGSFRHIDDSPCGGPGMVIRVDNVKFSEAETNLLRIAPYFLRIILNLLRITP